MDRVQELCMAYTIGDAVQFNHLLCTYDAIIVEGYECVGKSHFIKDFKEDGYPTYRPSYEKGLDNLVERSQRSLPGIIAIDAHVQGNNKYPLILDRGLPSGLVYGQLLQGKTYADYNDMIKLLNNISNNILIIYKYHSSELDAKMIHQMAMRSRNVLDQYDTADFSEYSEKYEKFELKFMEVFKFLGYDTLGINSMNSESIPLLARGGSHDPRNLQ